MVSQKGRHEVKLKDAGQSVAWQTTSLPSKFHRTSERDSLFKCFGPCARLCRARKCETVWITADQSRLR